MNIRELFNKQLGNSEVVPASCIKAELMRKVAVKEFLRFNPARFNIYYSGLILAGAVTAIVLVTSGPGQGNEPSLKADQNRVVPSTIVLPDTAAKQNAKEITPGIRVENRISTEKRSSGKSGIITGVKVNEVRGSSNINKRVAISDSLKMKGTSIENISGKRTREDRPVELQKSIEAAFDVTVTSGCYPLRVKFLNRSISFDSCYWVFGDGGSSSKTDPEWIFDNAGEYRVVLNVFNSNGNQSSVSSLITVHSRPQARFEAMPEKPVIPDDEIRFMNLSVDAVRYRWEFGDGNNSNLFEPYHKYKKYDKYNVRLIVWSEYGCSDTAVVKNAFMDSGCYIVFPNAFIPGTDGPVGGYYTSKSDESARIFHPSTSGVSEYQLRIFSKLGILIFESNDINVGWDGYLKGQLCEPGVYVWKVRGSFKNGEPFVKMGDVTILKN
jgi:PKD repeat protein